MIRERTRAGLDAAKARGRLGGRPPALNAHDLAAAKALLRDPEITVEEVARRLGVAPSTLYRHLPKARSAVLENLAYLERVDPARNMLRFYAIRIAPTLFGEWAVVREWGRIGSPGREQQRWFASEADALAAGLKAQREKERRGYRPSETSRSARRRQPAKFHPPALAGAVLRGVPCHAWNGLPSVPKPTAA